MNTYPALSYPDIYILNGGYSAFWHKGDRTHCNPQAYVEMNDAAHARTCEKEMGKFRRNTKFTRTQSFTYGLSSSSSGSSEMDSSPSANLAAKRSGFTPCRNNKNDIDENDGTPLGPSTLKQRRMASY
jgi:M-phase inducer tyrosine phosphatase